MAKVTLSDVSTLNGINSNFQRLEDELNNKALYRNNPTGEPNTMESSLDMNGERIFNLPAPLDLNEPARLSDIQDIITGDIFVGPDAGNLTGSEEVPIKRGTSVLKTTLTGIAQWVLQTYQGFTQSGTGAVARTVRDKQREQASIADYGGVGDGVTDDTAAVASAEASGKLVDGLGLVFKVTALPADFSRFRRTAFKLGSVIHPTEDFLQARTAKITNARTYTAWPQDKAYVVGNQVKVWCNFGDAHLDGDIRPGYVISDDGGVSYQEVTLLDPTLYGHTCWSAGVASGFEYAIVRTTDTAPWAYKLYKRAVPTGSGGDYSSAWAVTNITFPVPVWSADNQPVMVHSFTEGAGGIIVVGGSFTEGAVLFTSSDGGANWVLAQTLLQSSTAEEPTVKYESGIYAGFMRHGGGGNPRFWISRDNLASIQFYSAPDGYFGSTNLDDSSIPLQLVNGVVYAFTAYRSGTQAGNSDDRPTPLFYIHAELANGDNIWNHAKTYRIGTAYHAENGGASGVGQGSVVHYNDKIILLYGSEERTGVVAPTNRINNLWQTVISLRKNEGQIDYRTLLADDRSANNPFLRTHARQWLLKEGALVVRSDHKLSTAYPNVPAAGANLIIDGLSSNAGVSIATSAGFGVFYSVTNAGSFSGIQMDNTTGTVRLVANGAEVARIDGSTSSWRPSADNTRDAGSTTRRWANTYSTNFRPGAGTATWTSGTGSPEGAVTATVGSMFTRTDGGDSTTLYVKESGAGNTGWRSKNDDPFLYVTKGGVNQSITADTQTKITWTTPAFDTNAWWDAGNNRYTPQRAGKYYVTLTLEGQGNVAAARNVFISASIYKNGSAYASSFNNTWVNSAGTGFTTNLIVGIVTMNGSTDFIEGFAFIGTDSAASISGNIGNTVMTIKYMSP